MNSLLIFFGTFIVTFLIMHPIIKYIVNEMDRNSRKKIAQVIRQVNKSEKFKHRK